MTRVCLVTDELHPFTPGGIGRILHNLVRDSLERSPELEFHVLLPEYVSFDEQGVARYFGDGVRAHRAQMRGDGEQTVEGDAVYPPATAYTNSWHAQSLDFLRALKRLGREGVVFDVIEFPDYRGWAFCTLQEKLLGLDFAETEIAVRVHSTDGILQRLEAREPDWQQIGRFELERKALHDAQRVVVHLPGIARVNADYYGFEPAWLEKVTVNFPPALHPAPSPPPLQGARRDILFITKLQPIKRPDVFVRGAAQFLRENPSFAGRAILACHSVDDAYRERLRNLVPRDLQDRFLFLEPGPERESLIPTSIVVIPSAYESFSVAAYEAAAAGAVLVLNGTCPAFAEGTPFRDSVNCFKFDGSVDGLAGALARAANAPPTAPVEWRVDPPYWLDRQRRRAVEPVRRQPLVSVVVTNFNLGRFLPQTLASVAASTYEHVEVIVVDDASTDALDATVLDRLQAQSRSDGQALQVVRNPSNRGLSAARNVGIRHARGEYVLPLDADDCISPRFVEIAVRALEGQREFDVVVPCAGYFVDDASLAQQRFCIHAPFLGDAPSFGLVANRMSCATSLLRRSLFDHFFYDEALTSYEDWQLYLRLIVAGHRFLVTNGVHFYYRKRPGSMVAGVDPERHIELVARILTSLPRPLPASVHLFAMLAPTVAHLRDERALREQVALLQDTRPLRYSLADALNSVIKRMPLLHPLLKASLARFGRTP